MPKRIESESEIMLRKYREKFGDLDDNCDDDCVGKKYTTRQFLSLKPEYWPMIVNGSKTIELRKGKMNSLNQKIAVYLTAPEQKIVGVLDVRDVLIAPKHAAWKIADGGCGVSQQAFFDYYKKNDFATLIFIREVTVLKRPIEKGELKYYGFRVPMSHRPQDDKDIRLLALIEELSK